jgi:alpha-D-xyloside xylohydrolase
MAIVDFTNQEAREWFASHVTQLLIWAWTRSDRLWRAHSDRRCRLYDGSDPVKMHNFYSIIYNETVFRAIEENGALASPCSSRALHMPRGRFPVH